MPIWYAISCDRNIAETIIPSPSAPNRKIALEISSRTRLPFNGTSNTKTPTTSAMIRSVGADHEIRG